jgi:hypothetical protein
MIALDCTIAFFGGALYEAACVGWTHYSESAQPKHAALFSALCAVSQIAGIGESISTWVAAPFFIVGYSLGTYAAVSLKRRAGNHETVGIIRRAEQFLLLGHLP